MTRDELASALAPTWDTAEVMTGAEYEAWLSQNEPVNAPLLGMTLCVVRVSRGPALIVLPIAQAMIDEWTSATLVSMLNNRLEYKYRDVIDPGWERREYEAAMAATHPS